MPLSVLLFVKLRIAPSKCVEPVVALTKPKVRAPPARIVVLLFS